jgi:hypothetical protein
MKQRLLVQTQLSNIVNGKFDLGADSGWQMIINRCREMLKLNADLYIDVLVPYNDYYDRGLVQLVTSVFDVNPDLWKKYGGERRLNYIEHKIVPNALATRYDFCWEEEIYALGLDDKNNERYDAVYINDPMLLRHYKAMFHVAGGYQPKFYVHSHFVDVPECPKFPQEASLWLGQCEAALRADYNFWQCESAMNQFFDSMGKWFTQDVVDDVRSKSMPSDDGYSMEEITQPIDKSKLRFSVDDWRLKTWGKIVLFFPNRISHSSGDYTNGVNFMFNILPELRKRRDDFVVVCGNPNLKFSNDQLLEQCGRNGYVKLHDFTLNRDEYKFVAQHSNISLGLYNKDPYGGTASRECIESGCYPIWLNNFEYASIANEAGVGEYVLAKPDLSDIVDVLDERINSYNFEVVKRLQKVVRKRCSYEQTVPSMMKRMGLL